MGIKAGVVSSLREACGECTNLPPLSTRVPGYARVDASLHHLTFNSCTEQEAKDRQQE